MRRARTAQRRLPIHVVATAEEAGEWTARRIVDRLVGAGHRRPFVLVCPAGRTPVTTYDALGRLAVARGLDLSGVVVAMMDEYLVDGTSTTCDADVHYSCAGYAHRRLLPAVNAGLPAEHRIRPENVRLPDPVDPGRYDDWLVDGAGADFAILASGASDGHVAFNPPDTPAASPTRIVELAASTRADNLATFPGFAGIDEVPRRGVTIGLRSLAAAKESVLLLLGPDKHRALRRLVSRTGFDPAWPASIVYACERAVVVADRGALGDLEIATDERTADEA